MVRGFLGYSESLCLGHELLMRHFHLSVWLGQEHLRGEGSCGGGGAPRDSAGSGATEDEDAFEM